MVRTSLSLVPRVHLILISLICVPSIPTLNIYRQRCAEKEGSVEIHPGGLMVLWIYDEKFLTNVRFLFGTLSFTAEEDDDLEHPTQE
jgi:hypothetical protein